MGVPIVIAPAGPHDAPFQIPVALDQIMKPESVYAHWDGSGAASAFYPAVSYYAANGTLLSRVFPSSTVAAGGVADCSYAPFLGLGGAQNVLIGGGGIPGLLQETDLAADVTVTSTSAAAPTVIIQGAALSYDGITTIRIDVNLLVSVDSRSGNTPGGNGAGYVCDLYDGSTRLAAVDLMSVSGVQIVATQNRIVYLTPTAGSHSYSLRGYRTVGAGATAATVEVFKQNTGTDSIFASSLLITQVNPSP